MVVKRCAKQALCHRGRAESTSRADVSFSAILVVDKLAYHLPLYLCCYIELPRCSSKCMAQFDSIRVNSVP